ncbi:hypothetical protein [Spiroplasma endosymbiont of Diplazon laetatorius]|uniref:hypothetical protein n=1 Tax=Spiroplasma endosymbiont of Diplazon laetatorius TaxID=3066322 RepID=UPI0030CB5D55
MEHNEINSQNHIERTKKIKQKLSKFNQVFSEFLKNNANKFSDLQKNALNPGEFNFLAERIDSAENQLLSHFSVLQNLFNNIEVNNIENFESFILYTVIMSLSIVLELSIFLKETLTNDVNSLISEINNKKFNKNQSYFLKKHIESEKNKDFNYHIESLRKIRNAIEHPLSYYHKSKTYSIQIVDHNNSNNIFSKEEMAIIRHPVLEDGNNYGKIEIFEVFNFILIVENVVDFILNELLN